MVSMWLRSGSTLLAVVVILALAGTRGLAAGGTHVQSNGTGVASAKLPLLDGVLNARTVDPLNQETSEDEKEPTRTPRSRDRTPTAIANEVRGLPTAFSDTDGDGEPDTPTPTATVNRTPTVRPTATFAPTTSENGMAASMIGPEGGTLPSPLGASLVVPEGALEEASTVSLLPVADTKLPVRADVSCSEYGVAISASPAPTVARSKH